MLKLVKNVLLVGLVSGFGFSSASAIELTKMKDSTVSLSGSVNGALVSTSPADTDNKALYDKTEMVYDADWKFTGETSKDGWDGKIVLDLQLKDGNNVTMDQAWVELTTGIVTIIAGRIG